MTEKISSPRNRSVRIDAAEKDILLAECLHTCKDDLSETAAVAGRIICGDIFDAAESLPKKFADLIIADPPYNINKKFRDMVFCRQSEAEYEQYTEKWLNKVLPLLKDSGSIYVCCDWTSSPAVSRVLSSACYLRNRITWSREKGRGAAANWKNSMEDIYFATKSKKYTFNLDAVKIRRRVIAPYRDAEGDPKDWHSEKNGNFRDTCPGNFWDDITVPFWSMPENTDHPAQKPEKLLAKLILASSDRGDVVFDPFSGSGSVSVAAKKLGRQFCGVEIDPYYCACAVKRLKNADSDREIQGFCDGVFYERNLSARRKK